MISVQSLTTFLTVTAKELQAGSGPVKEYSDPNFIS
jgi:hypothetical protein